MKTQTDNLTVALIVAVVVLAFWGSSESSNASMLERDLEVYRTRLLKYEDSSVVDYILDSLHQDFAEQREDERRAMGR